jgi:hypothetical protein
MVPTIDTSTHDQFAAEVFGVDAVYVTIVEDAVTHAFALLVAGLDAVDLLRSRALGRGRLLAFRALPALGRLLLFTLLPFGALLLLALTPLHLLLLLALLALGTLHVALTLTLDLLRALALRTLDGAPLRRPFGSRLAALHARCGSLRRCRTRRAAVATSTATAAVLAFVAAILRLCYAHCHGSAEQQHTCRSGNQSSVHRYSPFALRPRTLHCALHVPAPNAGGERVFRCETEQGSGGR